MKKKILILAPLLGAILVGTFYILPPIFVWRHLNLTNEPFILAQLGTYKDEVTVYLARAREIYDGHFPPQDLYFSEQRPTVLNPLPPLLFSGFIFLFGGNINLAYLGAQFFFSGAIFLLFFFLGRFLFHSRLWSWLFAFVGVLTPLSFIFYRWGMDGTNLKAIEEIISLSLKQFLPVIKTQIHKLFLARIDDQLLTYPVYLSSIFFFFRFWQKPSYKAAVLAAIPAGLLFYTYFHYWVFWMAVLGILFIPVSLSYRQNKNKFRKFLILIGIVSLIAAPYFINYVKVMNLSDHRDYVYRFGLATDRGLEVLWQFNHQYPFYALLLFFAYFLYFKKDRDKFFLFSGCALAMFLAGNLQLITGFMPVPGQISKPISLLVFLMSFVFIHDLVKKLQITNKALKKFGFAVLILLVIAVPLKKAVNVFAMINPSPEIIDAYVFPKDIADSWNWINDNLEHESKIISPSLITSLYLNIYTSVRPFLATGFASTMPMKVLEERFLASNKLFEVSDMTIRNRFLDEFSLDCPCFKDTWFNLNKNVRFLYVNYFSRFSKDSILSGDNIPEGYFDELIERYSKMSLDWSDTNAEYVYYGPWEKQYSKADLSEDPGLEEIYRNQSVEIYKILR